MVHHEGNGGDSTARLQKQAEEERLAKNLHIEASLRKLQLRPRPKAEATGFFDYLLCMFEVTPSLRTLVHQLRNNL